MDRLCLRATAPAPKGNIFEPMRPRGWILVLGVLLTAALCCAAPVYWFFLYCPVPPELLETKRRIRIGMTMEQAAALLPPDHLKEGRGDTKRFSGFLRTAEPCSVQCEGRLEVKCDNGIVTGVTLTVYNDFDHSSRAIE